MKEFEECLTSYLETYNLEQAHPYRWTYTGEPLVRATPFSQSRRQRRQGRAWFGTRPPMYERLLHPPRVCPANRVFCLCERQPHVETASDRVV